MPQASYVIPDSAGLALLANLNAITAAIRTLNSGATAPTETAPYMLWVDTSNAVIMRRNSADSAWVLHDSAVANATDAKSGAYTAAKSDHKRFIRFTGSGGFTLAFTAAATLGEGWLVMLRNDSTGTITLDPNGTEQIDGGTTLSLLAGQSCWVVCTGSAFYSLGLSSSGSGQQPGEICYFATNTLPTGFLKCNGAAVSRTTYAALFAALVKSSTVTMTIASPGVITWNAHGRSANDPVKFSTTGALPTGLTAGTTYYVVGASITTNTFQVSASAGGAAINTSGTQSGTHTAIHAPFGDGDGSTTFNLPELRGEFLRGWDDGRAIDSNRAFGSSQTDAMQGHFHGGVISAITTSANFSAVGSQAGQVPANTTAPTSDGTNGTPRTAAETRPRNVALMACIKF